MQVIIQGEIRVGNTPEGGKVLQVTDEARNLFILPMTAEQARSVGAALSTSLLVANGATFPQPITH